jgi:hypothetical protein
MPRTKWAVLIIALCLIGFFSRITQQQKHRHHRHHLPALRQAAFSRHASSRCRGTRLRWCGPYYHQKPQPVKLGPAFDKPCPNQCSGVGVCNAMTGLCDCPAGDFLEAEKASNQATTCRSLQQERNMIISTCAIIQQSNSFHLFIKIC